MLFKENLEYKRIFNSDKFTKRENEIMNLLCKGLNTPEISRILKISPRTINNHRYKIMKKSKCKNIATLVKSAMSNNLVV